MSATAPQPTLDAQVYQVVIRATPEQIWEAITTPQLIRQYFHGASITVTDRESVSHGPDGGVWAQETVAEYEPPRQLTHRLRSLYDPEMAAEEPSRVTWEMTYPKPFAALSSTHSAEIAYEQIPQAPSR